MSKFRLLQSKILLMLLRFVYFGRNAIASSNIYRTKKFLLSTASASSSTSNDVLRLIFHRGEYNEAIKLADKSLELTDSLSPDYVDLLLASMAAHACGRNSAAVRKLFKKMPSDASHIKALEILLHAYCVADNIVFTEKLLYNWINSRISTVSPSQSILNFISDLESRQSGKNNDRDEELESKMIVALEGNAFDIPIRTWASIARFYSHRHAWIQCLLIVKIVEEQLLSVNQPNRSLDSTEFSQFNILSHPKSNESEGNSRFLWQLLDERCFIAQEDVPTNKNKPPLESSHLMTPRKQKEALFSIYHSAVIALCECHQFEEALQVVHRMRSLWNESAESSVEVNPLISVVPALLKVFISTNPSPDPWGFNSTDNILSEAIQLDHQHQHHHSQPLQPLHDEMVRTVAQLSRHPSHSGEGRAALALLRQYTHTLCELQLVDTAEQTLRQLLLLPHRPRVVTDSRVLHPLIHSHGVRGDWRRAQQLFESGVDGAGVVGGRQLGYHSVCDAMRRAGEIVELTQFVLKHGSLEGRDQN